MSWLEFLLLPLHVEGLQFWARLQFSPLSLCTQRWADHLVWRPLWIQMTGNRGQGFRKCNFYVKITCYRTLFPWPASASLDLWLHEPEKDIHCSCQGIWSLKSGCYYLHPESRVFHSVLTFCSNVLHGSCRRALQGPSAPWLNYWSNMVMTLGRVNDLWSQRKLREFGVLSWRCSDIMDKYITDHRSALESPASWEVNNRNLLFVA